MPAVVHHPAPASTRQRLLDAAASVCGKHGLRGATTREIAAAAEVNEVTLFRHFGSKENLVAALVQRSVDAHLQALENTPPAADLEADLRRFAECFHRLLCEHEPLIRAMVGEVHQYPAEARRLITEAVLPLRQRLRDALETAQRDGRVRRDLALAPAVDCFTGTLFSEMLRRTEKPQTVTYTAAEFIDTAIRIFLSGIVAAKRPKKK